MKYSSIAFHLNEMLFRGKKTSTSDALHPQRSSFAFLYGSRDHQKLSAEEISTDVRDRSPARWLRFDKKQIFGLRHLKFPFGHFSFEFQPEDDVIHGRNIDEKLGSASSGGLAPAVTLGRACRVFRRLEKGSDRNVKKFRRNSP